MVQLLYSFGNDDNDDRVKCPKCWSAQTFGSTSRNNSTGKNEVVNNCKNCGYSWNPTSDSEIGGDPIVMFWCFLNMLIAGTITGFITGYALRIDPLFVLIWILFSLPVGIFSGAYTLAVGGEPLRKILEIVASWLMILTLIAAGIGTIVFVYLSFTGQIHY